MTIEEALRESGLESIDAELLAAHACGQSRTWVMAHIQDQLNPSAERRFTELRDRRKRGEPVAYILGVKEFFGRMFRVTPDTLIPRPATEALVQITLDALAGNSVDAIRTIDTQIVAWSILKSSAHDVKLVIDVGTGSGCIAVTLACERPDLQIIATDISKDALQIAQQNAELMHVENRIAFKEGSGLRAAGLIDQPFLLVSNPPYIPKNTPLDSDVADFEPLQALFAGPTGTDVLSPLIGEALAHPLCRGFVVECREDQVALEMKNKAL